jgi:hypothetical protein
MAIASANAATITAASGSSSDVQTAINLAVSGDTVSIPTGTSSWTAGIAWTAPANVTLKGAGTSVTGGEDKTVIIDNIASGDAVMNIDIATSGVFRITGITIQSGTGATKDGGTLKFIGPGVIRVDHMHFVMTSTANYKVMLIGEGVFGVMHNSILDLLDLNGIYLYNGRSGPTETTAMGNLEWSLPTDFGGTNYFFIEDNIINGSASGGTYPTRLYDGFTAAKAVTRFNTLTSSCISETHDTGHAPDDRGMRSQEIYGNLVTSTLSKDPNYVAVTMGNGTALVWGNSWDQVYKNIYVLKVTRKNNGTYNQIATPDGWGYAGTAFNGTGSAWDGGTALGTDTTLGYPCLDQPGRGQGDLLLGAFPNKTNSTTGTIYWPNQALEPIYIWNNTGSIVSGWGGNTYSDDTGGRVVTNRDYYPPASGIQTSSSSPFNGTSGTGWGTLANRPTTCTAGVAYFATDQGSWNTSTTNTYGVQMNGADGVLYKATAANTWTLYYTPYTYPHPLRSESTNQTTTTAIYYPFRKP